MKRIRDERKKEKLTDQRESELQMEAAREGSSASEAVDAQMLREEDDEQTTLQLWWRRCWRKQNMKSGV